MRCSRFDTILVQQGKKQIYYASFRFIYFEQTLVQIIYFFHLDVNILNMIMFDIYIYIYIYNLQYIYTVYIHTRNKFLKYI